MKKQLRFLTVILLQALFFCGLLSVQQILVQRIERGKSGKNELKGKLVDNQMAVRRLRMSEAESFAADYALQGRLLEQGLFAEPVVVERQILHPYFADSSSDTAEQLADLMLKSEERLAEAGIISPAEIALIKLHREHFPAFTRAVQRILARNPWSLILRNEQTGKIVGFVFSGMIRSDTVKDLPNSSPSITQATLENARSDTARNTYVDFWFTGINYGVAEAVIKASFETARAINVLGTEDFRVDNFYAYSNPRGFWRYPDMSPEEYARRVQDPNDPLRDPSIRFHFKHGAELALIIPGAFPLIVLRGDEGVMKGAIGDRYAFVMRYPSSVWGSP